MSEFVVGEHWSKECEEQVAYLLSCRAEAQLEVDESLAEGDLFGAATGSFKYGIASLEQRIRRSI